MIKEVISIIILYSAILFETGWAKIEKGIYIWPITFYEMGGPENVIALLEKNKISDIFLLVKGEAGYSFFPSDYTYKDYYENRINTYCDEEERSKLLSQYKFFNDSTLLTRIINAAHQHNIKIHAWFIISGDKHFVETHPGAEVVQLPNLNIDKHPYPLITKGHINLAYAPYKQHIFTLIRKALQYPFDGLMLDKIRYTSIVYSWDEIHISKALRAGVDINKVIGCAINTVYGKEPDKEDFICKYRNNDKDIRKWIEIKKEDVEEYVKEAYKIAREKNITLSASFMPEGAYDEDFADVYYAQNYKELSHYFDFIAVMAYPKSFNQPVNWLKMVMANAKEKSSCKIWTAIQCYDSVSSESVFDQVKNARIANSDGIAIFRLGEMTENMWDAFHKGIDLNIEKLFEEQKTGIIYTGNGTIRNCWQKSTEALLRNNDIIPLLLKEDALINFDSFNQKKFILIPGGSGSEEAEALDTMGLQNIDKFVSLGGGYIGICAGSYLPIKGYNANLTEKLQIVNAEAKDIQHWNRGNGEVQIKVVNNHPIFSGITEDNFKMNYYCGPILEPSDLSLPKYKELAVFKTDYHENGATPGDMLDKTAILEAQYHKGKIILFSPHPELTPGKEHLLVNAVKYVSGK